MSTFRRDIEVVLDGEVFKCQTRAVDHTAAEVILSKDGATAATRPMTSGMRVAFAAFRRTYPDHELAKSFSRWLDQLDDVEGGDDDTDETDGEALEPDPMDPIRPAGGEDWP